MAGAIVTAALLLSGLSLISSYQQPVIAQQDATGAGGTTGGGGGTTGGSTVCILITGGATTGNATTTMRGAAQGGNATTTAGEAGENDSMSQIRMHLEEARRAFQNNDTPAAMMNLDLALNALGGPGDTQGNMTGTTGGNATEGGTTARVK